MYLYINTDSSYNEVTPHPSAPQREHSLKAIRFSSNNLFLDRITIENISYTKYFERYSLRCMLLILNSVEMGPCWEMAARDLNMENPESEQASRKCKREPVD